LGEVVAPRLQTPGAGKPWPPMRQVGQQSPRCRLRREGLQACAPRYTDPHARVVYPSVGANQREWAADLGVRVCKPAPQGLQTRTQWLHTWVVGADQREWAAEPKRLIVDPIVLGRPSGPNYLGSSVRLSPVANRTPWPWILR